MRESGYRWRCSSQSPPSLQSRGAKELLSCPLRDPFFDLLNGHTFSAGELGEAFTDPCDEFDLAGDLVKRDVGRKLLENRLNGFVRANDGNENTGLMTSTRKGPKVRGDPAREITAVERSDAVR